MYILYCPVFIEFAYLIYPTLIKLPGIQSFVLYLNWILDSLMISFNEEMIRVCSNR